MKKTAHYAMAMLLVPWLSCTNNPVQNLANPPMEKGEKAKMILHLREVEGYAYKEIAAVLGLSMDEVKTVLR